MNIRRLTVADAAAFVALRRAALLDSPLSFAASPADDFVSSPDAVAEHLARGDDSVIFGAFEGNELAGSVGIYRDRHLKAAHKAHIWGMFVVPSRRRRGMGRELLNAAIEHARTLDGITRIDLAVSSDAREARMLYLQAGFAVWGTEPDALRDGGRSVSEDHMILILAAANTRDRDEVVAVTESVFAAMRSKNEAAMRTVIRPEAPFVSARVNERKLVVRNGDEFIRGILANPAVLDERMFDPRVDSDGTIAVLHAAYDFHVDGRFSHKGMDVFVFLHEDGHWSLVSAAYTVL